MKDFIQMNEKQYVDYTAVLIINNFMDHRMILGRYRSINGKTHTVLFTEKLRFLIFLIERHQSKKLYVATSGEADSLGRGTRSVVDSNDFTPRLNSGSTAGSYAGDDTDLATS